MFSIGNILFNTFFAVISAVLGVIFGKIFSQPSNIYKSNSTEIYIIREYIERGKANYKCPKGFNSSNNNISSQSSYSVGEIFLFIIVVGVLTRGFYTKYYTVILEGLITVSIIILVSSIAFLIVLAVRKSLDGLSKYWLVITMIMTFVNIISIVLMYEQDLTKDNSVESIWRIVFYFIGVVFLALANLFTVFSYAYILSINIYLKWENRVTYKFMNFFDQIYSNRGGVTVVIFCLVAFSLLMSSGLFASLVQNITENNNRNIEEIMNSTQR
ncbi:MAG: hypothetical protein KIC94_14150 [Clostridiales bacterium]|nr:hypothetical protein [Clostridiales bacterium]